MSNGPVTGNGIAITLPPGKMVFWSAVAQAAYPQFVQVKDENGNVVLQADGGSPDGHSPTQYGQGFFSVNPAGSGKFSVWIGVNKGATWQSVMWSSGAIQSGSNIYFGNYVFISEDGADADYNDTCLTLQWFEHLG